MAYDRKLRFRRKKKSWFDIYIIINRDSQFHSISVGKCVASGKIQQFRWHTPVLSAKDLLKEDHLFYYSIRMISSNAVFEDVQIVELEKTTNGG